ncbi:hypothetical protein P7C73_g6387, partial [Tremellales sp. Uapishka_1]
MSSSASPTQRSVLPLHYYYFFFLVEPALTIAGAFYAIFMPEKYGADLLPPRIERVTSIVGGTTRGQMVIGGLGSCELAFVGSSKKGSSLEAGFLLLAMISLSLFPIIKNTLKGQPEIQLKLVKGLLVPLAIADYRAHPTTPSHVVPPVPEPMDDPHQRQCLDYYRPLLRTVGLLSCLCFPVAASHSAFDSVAYLSGYKRGPASISSASISSSEKKTSSESEELTTPTNSEKAASPAKSAKVLSPKMSTVPLGRGISPPASVASSSTPRKTRGRGKKAVDE